MKNILLIFIYLFIAGCKSTSENKANTASARTEISDQKNAFPASLGYVSDFENTLTEQQIAELNKILSDYDLKTSNQIAIVSVEKNLTEDEFYQYALDLSNNWGVGTKEKDNGLTIIYSKKLHAIRICTGNGTEKILTDKICEDVLQNHILPEFRKDDYYSGLKNGVQQFIEKWK